MVNTQLGAIMPTLSHFGGGAGGLTGTFVHARGQWDCCKSTRCPTFPQHSQTNVLCKESWLMITMSRCRTGSFQGFASFISTPEFINDEAHQSYSYPNLLVNLGTVGLHGDPHIFNKALKHPGAGPSSGSPNTLQWLWRVTEHTGTLTHFISPVIVPRIFSSPFTFFHQICWGFLFVFSSTILNLNDMACDIYECIITVTGIYIINCLFSKHLLSACCMPGTV